MFGWSVMAERCPPVTLRKPDFDEFDRCEPNEFDLEWIVGDIDDFGSSIWGRRPMYRSGVTGFDRLLDTGTVQHWLANGARRPNFRLVKVGSSYDERDYTRTVRMGGIDVHGVADPAAIAARMTDGATLVLQNLELVFAQVGALAARLAEAMSHPVQANAYLTPPNAAGLARHADTHDVLILQLQGSKSWEVEGLGQLELVPGDVIYIPKGTPHVASTSSATSFHLTLGLMRISMRGVLRRMLDQLDPMFDDPLPVGFAHFTEDELVAVLAPTVCQALSNLAAVDLRDVARAELGRVERRTSPPGTSSLARAFAELHLTDSSLLRRIVDCHLEVLADAVTLHLPNRQVTFPLSAHAALQTFHASQQISVCDLVGIDAASQLVVARRLIRDGAAVAAPADIQRSDHGAAVAPRSADER